MAWTGIAIGGGVSLAFDVLAAPPRWEARLLAAVPIVFFGLGLMIFHYLPVAARRWCWPVILAQAAVAIVLSFIHTYRVAVANSAVRSSRRDSSRAASPPAVAATTAAAGRAGQCPA